MKEIKFIFRELFIAAYVSNWWALAKWGWVKDGINSPNSYMIPSELFCVFGTIGIVAFCLAYIAYNWSN